MKRVYRATCMFWKCLGRNAPKRVTPNTENTCRRDQRRCLNFTQPPWRQDKQLPCKAAKGIPGVQAQRPLLFSINPLPPVPSDLGVLVREREQLGVGESTDQHEEKDEGHDVGHVRHRLQDDTDDPGQRLHRHAHMYQTKCPMAQPLRGAPRPLPRPSAPLTPNLPRGAETIPTPSFSRDPDRCPSFPQSSQLT